MPPAVAGYYAVLAVLLLADMCIFENVLIFLLTNSFGLKRKSKVCFYTLNKVSYTSNYKNNPKATPNFKEPNLVGII